MRIRISAVGLLCSFALAGMLAAQTIDDTPDAVSLYAKGRRLMRQANWLEASRIFEELSGRFPNSPNADLFLFNRARSDYYFGEYDKALAGFNSFVSRFTASPYRAHALFFLGNIQYLRGRVTNAITSYIKAYGLSTDDRLDRLLRASITEAVRRASEVYLVPEDFSAVPATRRCGLIKDITQPLLLKNLTEVAATLLQSCGEKLPENMRPAQEGTRRSLDIAVVLPFSGELQSFADQIYNGAVIAADLYRRENGKALKLTRYDTEGSPVNAARIVRNLGDASTDAIVGPLTSDAAAVTSAVLSCEKIPLIAPAATQAGLTELSGSVFQLSPNLELQAVRMAEYAAMNLFADSAAIITSTQPDHLLMTRAFARRFGELGGTIVAIEYYRPRDTDFGAYIRDIKSILLGWESDSAVYINANGDTLHMDEVPAYLDCLYLPANSGQLRQLLPQIRFYSVNTTYLGSDGWGDESVYRLGDDVTRGALFPSPYLHLGTGVEYDRFSRAFDARYGKVPDRLAALGYDAVRAISWAATHGGTDRPSLIKALASLQGFQGAAARISFGEHHENTEMPIYRIQNGAAEPLVPGGVPPDSTESQQ